MKKIFLLMSCLIFGLFMSQSIPAIFGNLNDTSIFLRQFLTMSLLSFIMIGVGREFDIDLKNKKKYVIDYFVAATAATFPWIFVFIYFLFFLLPENSTSGNPLWIEALLTARFAAPTSAGVLFSMLGAAGLSATWTYNKTKILAIFDDLDTVLLMIPLQILIVGFAWQLGGVILIMTVMIILGIKYYKKLNIPQSWPWILFYSLIITGISEALYFLTKNEVTKVGLHIEILLPAFLLGLALNSKKYDHNKNEDQMNELFSMIFLFLVGFSMPLLIGEKSNSLTYTQLFFHTIMITIISNLGKMFACLCYKKEASFRERLAVSVAMFPRGEVGAGILAMTIGYGITGPFVTVAFLSLTLNLLLTGFFIFLVKKLLSK